MTQNTTTSSVPLPAHTIRWNLDDLYPDTESLEMDLHTAESEADDFSTRYHGKVSGLDAEGLAEALRRYESLMQRVGRAGSYAYLLWCGDTNDPARGALLQKVREQTTRTSQKVLFFELEWIGLDEETALSLLESPQLERFRHFLRLQRRMKPHVLSEAEEKILSEKEVTGASAWVRFFDETLAAARFPYRDRDLTEQEVLTLLYDPDRDVRREAAEGLTEGLRRRLRETTYVFNTLLGDKMSEDRLRNYPHWLSSRNLSNEITDEAVRALVESVRARYDLVARYYRLKKRLLGLDELFDYDRYAPLPQAARRVPWEQARDVVLDAFSSFHPKMGSAARRFFEDSWIDAAVKPGKRGGAFSHATVPAAHPYILMNYTGNLRDVQTLAHELGHGVHQYVSRSRGLLHCRTPLTTSETASVFGEMLVFERLLERETDPSVRLAMLVSKIDDTTATVFRQIAMNRFEDQIHTARRSDGELSSERFSLFWMETQREMFQGSVTLGEHYRIWWSYIPHFVHTPGYVYAYTFGELLVLALYSLYREGGSSFPARYLELLEAGGSDWPHVLVGRLGVDLTDRNFWQQGLDAIERMIEEAEKLER